MNKFKRILSAVLLLAFVLADGTFSHAVQNMADQQQRLAAAAAEQAAENRPKEKGLALQTPDKAMNGQRGPQVLADSRAIDNSDNVIGRDHPQNPGDVMLFKEAREVPGMVNTWDITLRVEAKDKNTPVYTVLVMDTSASMSGERLRNAQSAAKRLVNELVPTSETKNRVALVSYNNDATLLNGFSRNKGALNSSIERLWAGGGTHTQAGIHKARQLIRDNISNIPADAVLNIVLLSDGEPTFSYWFRGSSTSSNYERKTVTHLEYATPYNTYPAYYDGVARIVKKGQPESQYDYRNTLGYGTAYNYRYSNQDNRFFRHGYAAVDEAGYFKDAAYSHPHYVYSVALQMSDDGEEIMRDIASSGNHFFQADRPSQLDGIFDVIAGQILSSCQQASVVDPMGEGFVVEEAQNIISAVPEAPAPTLDPANHKITWAPGTLKTPISAGSDIKYAELVYRIEITDEILNDPTATLHSTNGDAALNFKDINGEIQNVLFPVPEVNPVLYMLRKVVLDSDGVTDITSLTERRFAANVQLKTPPPEMPDHTYNKNYVINTAIHNSTSLLTSLRLRGVYNVAETQILDEHGAPIDDASNYYTTKYYVGKGLDYKTHDQRQYFDIRDNNTDDVYITIENQRKPA